MSLESQPRALPRETPAAPDVLVPAELLTRACILIGQLPAKHAGQIYVELLACQTAAVPPLPGGLGLAP